ncbi:hypothetical protein [Sutterella wadsworthensis]|uniref:CRISPR-associated endonuclease Cas2 n=1 Tax=Sutterella wadsworthensis TaxID=40545 RepID=UPI003966E3FD
MHFIIAYDVTSPSRLQRLHKALCEYALPIQKSVFLLMGSEAQFARVVTDHRLVEGRSSVLRPSGTRHQNCSGAGTASRWHLSIRVSGALSELLKLRTPKLDLEGFHV